MDLASNEETTCPHISSSSYQSRRRGNTPAYHTDRCILPGSLGQVAVWPSVWLSDKRRELLPPESR